VLYEDPSCIIGSPEIAYELDGVCRSTGFGVGEIMGGLVKDNVDVGTCPPSGTGMIGTATPTDPHTVCCVAP
jgi:hypothetical protein